MAAKPDKITAADVRLALKKYRPAPEYAVLFEVLDATGAQNTRSADAVIISCWPSRGLEMHGVEIKVSRRDWMTERSKPAKAETIAAYCDRWYLFTGPGVIHDIGEIPPAWGWVEFDGKRLMTHREAQLTDAKPLDRLFLASLMRNAAKVGDKLIEAARVDIRAEYEARYTEKVAALETSRAANPDLDRLKALVDGFEEETGIKLADRDTFGFLMRDGKKVGQMLTALRKAGLGPAGVKLGNLEHQAREVLRAVESVRDLVGPFEEQRALV